MINARRKGHGGEREVVKILKKYGIIASRNLEQTREGGHDLITKGTVLEDYAIEIKTIGKWSNACRKKYWEQAVTQAKKVNKIPLLIWKINYCLWFIEYEENGELKIDYFEEWLEKTFKKMLLLSKKKTNRRIRQSKSV